MDDTNVTQDLNSPSRRKRSKKSLSERCQVCSAKASTQQHYGSKAHLCFSCRAFFRRCVKTNREFVEIECNNHILQAAGTCQITTENRSVCSYCRYQKCCSIGLNINLVMTRDDIAEMKEKVRDAKCTGIQAKYLAQTSYEKRCQGEEEVELNVWEPDENFLQWLLKDDQTDDGKDVNDGV